MEALLICGERSVQINTPLCVLTSACSKSQDNLRKVVSAINSKYPKGRPKSINWADAAKQAQTAVLYNMIYRCTSGGATHVTINALDRHVKTKSNDPLPYANVIEKGESLRQPLTLTFQPETRDLDLALSGATSAILHAMHALNRIFPQKGIDRTMKHYSDIWLKLLP